MFRKFEEAEPNHPEANLAMGWIGELYAIDQRAGDDLERRLELRQTESKEVLAKLKAWLWSQAVLKTLSIGRAAAYAIANWDRLTRFVDNPLVPLDNNGTERGIRGPVVGRKNHYGSKSKRATEVAATFYSLLETAKLHTVDPARYLREAALVGDRGDARFPGSSRTRRAEAAGASTMPARGIQDGAPREDTTQRPWPLVARTVHHALHVAVELAFASPPAVAMNAASKRISMEYRWRQRLMNLFGFSAFAEKMLQLGT